MCYGRKLSKTGLLKTEGYCDSIAIYRRSLVSYGLVLGITYPSSFETKRFQVHTMDFYGNTLVKIFYDNMGKTLFHGKVFVTGTPKSGEIIVSDNVGGTIQGFNTRTSEGLFKLDVQAPLGISVDNSHNIYVISNSCFYWIPRHRENAVAILKRGHRSKSTNCCYDNRTSTLAVTSTHSETVQLYKIL
ncbi:hypothetical protein DPMN_181802 [Dreissena polymorpha]|uniref:Uncharacterized protein n=1 Tax=Dreissena polymorpha TaxID=45954 RepID=A0A9D4DD06_DREPO|nr:hypothetical protein DPMN_181802 [Dreissena polymorpha]